jgi:hypothetical protein
MRITQVFAEQKAVAALRASFGVVKGVVANETMTCHKEQVGVMFRQVG